MLEICQNCGKRKAAGNKYCENCGYHPREIEVEKSFEIGKAYAISNIKREIMVWFGSSLGVISLIFALLAMFSFDKVIETSVNSAVQSALKSNNEKIQSAAVKAEISAQKSDESIRKTNLAETKVDTQLKQLEIGISQIEDLRLALLKLISKEKLAPALYRLVNDFYRIKNFDVVTQIVLKEEAGDLLEDPKFRFAMPISQVNFSYTLHDSSSDGPESQPTNQNGPVFLDNGKSISRSTTVNESDPGKEVERLASEDGKQTPRVAHLIQAHDLDHDLIKINEFHILETQYDLFRPFKDRLIGKEIDYLRGVEFIELNGHFVAEDENDGQEKIKQLQESIEQIREIRIKISINDTQVWQFISKDVKFEIKKFESDNGNLIIKPATSIYVENDFLDPKTTYELLFTPTDSASELRNVSTARN